MHIPYLVSIHERKVNSYLHTSYKRSTSDVKAQLLILKVNEAKIYISFQRWFLIQLICACVFRFLSVLRKLSRKDLSYLKLVLNNSFILGKGSSVRFKVPLVLIVACVTKYMILNFIFLNKNIFCSMEFLNNRLFIDKFIIIQINIF